MTPEKVKFWNSLVSRFAVFFAGLNILAILVVGYLVYRQAATVIVSHNQERMRYSTSLAVQSFNSLLNEVANDIAITTQTPVVRDFVLTENQVDLSELEELFSITLANKPSYFQIRLLNAGNNGKELLRYDKKQGQVIRIPDNKLQFKGDRNYYQEALKINPGSYYYSDINLNEEFGEVSEPQIPTLRAVGQVYDENQVLSALLVINVDLSGLYQELTQIMESDNHMMLINESGDYLFAPDSTKCFGTQLNSGFSFNRDFGTSVDSLVYKNQFGFIQDNQQSNYLFHLEELNYSPGQRIYLMSMLEDNQLFSSAYAVRKNSLQLVLLVCLISLVVVYFFARIFSRNINRITEAVSSYEEATKGPEPHELPEQRNDELGVLARTFSRMRQRINQQLTDLKSALLREQQAIKERDLFLENMSHELRTPLNAILGLSRLLSKNNPTPALQPIIESLERSAVNLSGLMHDVLDHRKLKEGQVYLNLVPANYYSLLSDIHAVYRYDAINKGLAFRLEVQDSLKFENYLTDPLRFTQAITNLVVNAIKFTDKGQVSLKASTLAEPDRIKVEVIDTGRGIEAQNLQKIQHRFYQVKSSESTSEDRDMAEGYGLGLSIVKQLADLFRGELEIQSTENAGSNFTLTIPLIQLPVEKHETKSSTSNKDLLPVLSNSYRILHLEDDPSTLMLVSHLLEIPGVSLVQVKSKESALAQLKDHTFDCILSDLMLNGEAIDEFLQNTDYPVIILSAFNPERMKLITPYYLQKPFEQQALIKLIVLVLGSLEYDIPQLEPLYQQYDHETSKIKNFLNILQDEFRRYLERFEKVYQTRDVNEWQAIMHKLTTHIRSMNLVQLSQTIPDQVKQMDESTLKAIKNQLIFCLLVFNHQYEQHKD